MRGYLPESQYDTKTREVLDGFYPRALQWCSTDPAPDSLVPLDISKCYPSILIDNESPIPLYTIRNFIKPFDGVFKTGEYYIDEYVIEKRLGKGIKIEADFYSKQLVQTLIAKFKMPISNVKWYIQARKTLAPDTFKNYMLAIFSMFPEPQAKLIANSYIGELGRKYSRKDHGFTCNSLDTAQCIWASALAENRDVVIDSYQNPNTKQELYLIRERQIERIFSDNTSINRFAISQSILKCLNMLHDNASHDNDGNGISQVYAINTDGVFMTNPKNQYPNKKDVKFTTDSIGQIFQTDSPAVYFEKHYKENFNPDNYTDYVGNGVIYFDGTGCGKTYRLCQKALAADDPIILSFTNKDIQNVKSVLFNVYNNYELAKKCYTFDLFFCDHHGRDITALEGKTIFVDEYSMTPNKWMTKLYQAFTKYRLTIYMFGDTNQCDPVEPSDMFYDYFESVALSEMCPRRVEMKYIEEYARYDPQTRDLLTKFLKCGSIKHQFEPPVDSYHNICFLNKTRRYVTQECCNRFTENLKYYKIDFKYQGHREKYKVAVGMPMIVTQNMRNKDMFNMEQYNIESINENDEGNLEFTLNGTVYNEIQTSSANCDRKSNARKTAPEVW